MDFELSDDQQAIASAVRELAAGFDDDYWRERDRRHEFPWDFYAAFAEHGWLGIAIPERWGGSGLGITEASILLREVAASGAGINGCSSMHLTIFGMTTFARHEDGHYVVSGKKVWTSKALECALLPRSAAGPHRAGQPGDGPRLLGRARARDAALVLMSTAPAQRLAGRSAIVTGAGDGIGAAVARRFAAEGAAVTVVDVDADAAEASFITGEVLCVDGGTVF